MDRNQKAIYPTIEASIYTWDHDENDARSLCNVHSISLNVEERVKNLKMVQVLNIYYT